MISKEELDSLLETVYSLRPSAFCKRFLWWAKKDSGNSAITHCDASSPCLALKINKIIDLVEITCQQPFKGIGKPESLKYIDSNVWSRQINLEHCLVCRVRENRIYFLQCRYHYV